MFSEGELAAGRYILQAKLAEGHLGPVFRAVDVESRNVVVLRPIDLPPAGVEVLERDLREVADLDHPNIAPAELRFTDDHQPFLAGEFIDGKPLDALIRDEGAFALPRACSLARQTAAALEAAHHAGIIHGDLTPSSVLVMSSADEEIVKVCGFGTYSLKKERFLSLVRLAMPGDGESLFGLPGYIAPEQALGTSGDALDGRSDLYSLGVILYQMLTGAVPYLGSSPMETLLANIFSAPPPFSSQLEIPLVVQTLVMRSLAKRRDDRPASATAVADQLAAWEQKKAAPAAAASLQAESERRSEAETSEAPPVTVLAGAQGGGLAAEPSSPRALPADSPPEFPIGASAEFVPDLHPSGAIEARSSANTSPPGASDSAIELDLAAATATPAAGRNLEQDLASTITARAAAPDGKEAGGEAGGLDVQFDAPPAPPGPERPEVASPPEPFFRPAAAGATIFRSFQPRPKRRKLKAATVAAIVILIILAGGCGWLYSIGRTYWFDPGYVKMRISTFFAGSSSTRQVQTDAYSQSAAPVESAPSPVPNASQTGPAGTSVATIPAVQPPEPGTSGRTAGQPSTSGTAADTAAQVTTPNSTPVVQPDHNHALRVKPAPERGPARPGVKRTSPPAETAQVVAGEVAAAVTRGDYYFDHGDYDAAIRAYEGGLTHAPGNQQLDSEIARARKAQAAEARYLR